MTFKEQIMKLQTYKMYEDEDTVYVERDDVLKLLEQHPCEDCISREQALEAIDTWDKFGDVSQYGLMRISVYDKTYVPYVKYNDIVECIKYLPSVQPQRKRGKWIFREDMGHQYCCSECGCPKPFVNDYYYKKIIGCPYCLADMRGDMDETN